jgi:hypothetical protein
MNELYAALDDHIKNYEQGTITISDDIEFSMHATVKQITHYILSKYTGGQIDKKTCQRKPFRNIGNAIVDLEWRAKNTALRGPGLHPDRLRYVAFGTSPVFAQSRAPEAKGLEMVLRGSPEQRDS